MSITECKPIDRHHSGDLGRLHNAHREKIVIYFIHDDNRSFGPVSLNAFKTGRRENSKFSFSLESDRERDVSTVKPVCVGVRNVSLAEAMINYRCWEKNGMLFNID